MIWRTASGLRLGYFDTTSAARPDSRGAADDVPLAMAYGSSVTHSQPSSQNWRGSVLMMFRPGAANFTSGPQSLKGECASGFCAVPDDATANAYGRRAGKLTRAIPSLPVAAMIT